MKAIVIKKSMDKTGIQKILSKLKTKKKLDAYKYCGVLKIEQNPLEIQKSMRDEWQQFDD